MNRSSFQRIEIVAVPERFYFKVGAAARYLGISPNSLGKYTDLGLIQAKRLPGGDRLYSKEVLDAFYAGLPDGVSCPGRQGPIRPATLKRV